MRSRIRRGVTLLATLTIVGIGVATTASPAYAVVHPEAWAGSPVTGTWNANAATHHRMLNNDDPADWATDISVAAGTPVQVYVAPQNSGYTITTKVLEIDDACAYGRNGGKFVRVGIFANGTRIGSISYAHIVPSVSVGQTINRWGGVVGTVGTGYPYNVDCWTGPHVHLEMYNTANYSCFNKGYSIGSTLNPTNFVGFAGGNRVSGTRKPCP